MFSSLMTYVGCQKGFGGMATSDFSRVLFAHADWVGEAYLGGGGGEAGDRVSSTRETVLKWSPGRLWLPGKAQTADGKSEELYVVTT